ncbi:hypothetical protein EON76_04980 [bacterium]|nr:MAG: hypothetical protein EON76_04980 [bacterium]
MGRSLVSLESLGIELPTAPEGEFIVDDKHHYNSYAFDEATFILSPLGEKAYHAKNEQALKLHHALLLAVNLATEYGTQISSDATQLHDVETKHHGVQRIGYSHGFSIGYVKTPDRLGAMTEFMTLPDHAHAQPRKLACVLAQSAVWLCAVPKTHLEQFHDGLVEAPSLSLETQKQLQDQIYRYSR